MKQPVSAWPTRLLLKHNWEDQKVPGELTILVERPLANAVGPQPTGILIRRGEQTLAWAKAVPFGERFIWPYAQVSDQLEDGANRIAISQVVGGTGIAEFIRQTSDFPVDVIGVGLESSHGGDSADIYRKLSDVRGSHLVEAVNKSITVFNPAKTVRYRTLGLGRALENVEKDSDAERRQRSALVIVIARMSHDTINLPETDALVKLLMDVDLTAVDLGEYEYSCMAAERLSPSLVFDDSVSETWSLPKVSAEDAIAMRTCN